SQLVYSPQLQGRGWKYRDRSEVYAVLTSGRRIARAVAMLSLVAVVGLRAAADAPAVPSDAAVSELHATVYRVFPSMPLFCRHCDIPLKADAKGTNKGDQIGVLAGNRGGTMRIGAGETANSVLHFGVSDVGPSGDYDGTIQLGPVADKQTTIKLSLLVKHAPIVAVATLLFGIVVALRLKRLIGVTHEMWILRRREAAVALLFATSQKKFTVAAAHHPWGAYDIEESFNDERQALLRRLSTLGGTSGLAVDKAS